MFFEVLGSLPIALLVCILFGVRPAGPTSDILFYAHMKQSKADCDVVPW